MLISSCAGFLPTNGVPLQEVFPEGANAEAFVPLTRSELLRTTLRLELQLEKCSETRSSK